MFRIVVCVVVVLGGVSVVLSGLGGCGRGLDAVYALPLDRAPTDEDWARSVPFRTEATGGRTTKPGESDVDTDTVHKATASCHHGTKTPPVAVELRAFHTPEQLYLNVRWADPTPHLGAGWSGEGSAWRSRPTGQDGVGVLWGGRMAGFTCVRACHLEDFRMAGARGLADYAMATPGAWGNLDLWEWKAGWGRDGGVGDDRRLGPDGLEPDTPGDRFEPNLVPGAQPIPRVAPPPEPGVRAPAYLDRGAPWGRTEVKAAGAWHRGWWSVTLSRQLTGSDAGDVTLTPGTEVRFGLALLDGVKRDHNAVPEPIVLKIVKSER